jgi:hypothetical protein
LFELVYYQGMSTSPTVSLREARQHALWQRTAVVAGRLNRAHGELVEIAVELIEDGHWGDGGFKTPEHYLVVRAGLSPAHAADAVRIARRRTELHEAAHALTDGSLSLDQVAVLARKVPASHQASATELARQTTVPQLRRAVGRHAFPHPDTPDTDDAAAGERADRGEDAEAAPRAGVEPDTRSQSERRACARPELSMHYDDDGRFQLRYSAPATIGALVEQAIREAKDSLFTARDRAAGDSAAGETATSDSPAHDSAAAFTRAAPEGTDEGAPAWNHTGRPTYADALAELAHRSMATVTDAGRASHYRVYLHLGTDGAWVGGGHPIPTRLLGRFLSDGILQPVWETAGRPVSVGRAMRILPERTRRLILDRDCGCRFPGCTTTGFLEIHHLHGWADGGRTDETNQVALCPAHHDGIDRGDYSLSGDPTRPDGLSAVNRYGIPIRPPTQAETCAPPGGDPPVPADAYTPPSGGPISWADTELGPDTDLPQHRPSPRAVLTAVHREDVDHQAHPHDTRDDPTLREDDTEFDDGLVFDSYRHGWR